MKTNKIVFTDIGKAELQAFEINGCPAEQEVLIETAYTAVSAGTERGRPYAHAQSGGRSGWRDLSQDLWV